MRLKTQIQTIVIAAIPFAGSIALADHHNKEGAAAAKEGAAAAKKGGDPAAMMEAMAKAGAPVEQHQMLNKMSGNWTAQVRSFMQPGAPPMESKATAQVKPILGGRFVQEDFKGDWMGQPFQGTGLTGYDKMQKKFVSTWADSMSTSLMVSSGVSDDTGKVITFTGEMVEPMTGKKQPIKMVSRIENDNKRVFEMYHVGPGKKEQKTMEIIYTRQ